MTILIKKDFQFLTPAIANNESRKSLMYIYIKVNQGEILLRTANAYMIKQIIQSTEMPDGEYYISRELALIIQKTAGAKDMIQLTEKHILVGQAVFDYSRFDHNYPDLTNLCNPERYGSRQQIAKIGFNSKFMTDIMKGSPSELCKMDFQDCEDDGRGLGLPMRISFNNYSTHTAFLMPVRLQW